MTNLETILAEVEGRLKQATPGPFETRCREFSNRAPTEIWTNLGWLDQLPREHREPTYEMFAATPDYLAKLLEIVRVQAEALEKAEGWLADSALAAPYKQESYDELQETKSEVNRILGGVE